MRAALIAALALAVAAASPLGAEGRPLVTGVSNVGEDGFSSAKGGAELYAQTHATGATFTRIPLIWPEVAPSQLPANWDPTNPADGHYNWTAIDEEVKDAVQAGLTPVLQIDSGPSWAQRCQAPSWARLKVCEPDPAALAAFATAAARRYSGSFPGIPRVKYWQALNEPNLSLYFNPQFNSSGKAVSAGLYRELINAFYAAIKGVNASDLVISAGLGPIAVPKYTIGPMQFARELLCMRGRTNFHPTAGNCGGGVNFDIFAIQPYTTGGPTHQGGPNDVELGDLPKLQRLLQAADRAGRINSVYKHTPLWITEFSWDSKPPDPGGLAMKIETRWVAEALYRAWTAGVSHFFWYSLRDDPSEPERPFSETIQSGLYFRGPTAARDRPKKFFYAFRFPFVAYPRKQGLFVWGRTPNSHAGQVEVQVRNGRHWQRALVAHANKQGIFQAVSHTRYGQDKHGSVRARFKGQNSAPFSMHPVRDFYQPPFGR